MFIGGPWDLGPIEDAGIGFAVDPLPSAAGFNLRAPTSVLGFYLASASPQSDAATTFLVDYLADASAQRALYLRDRRASRALGARRSRRHGQGACGRCERWLPPSSRRPCRLLEGTRAGTRGDRGWGGPCDRRYLCRAAHRRTPWWVTFGELVAGELCSDRPESPNAQRRTADPQ